MPVAQFLKSASDPAGFPPDDCSEVAFVGRSNSGKSSAINAVTGARKLARVSKTPGRTQLINFFTYGPGHRLVDLPGYGFARAAPAVRQRWRGLLEAYLSDRPGLRGIVITLDVRRGIMELDAAMIEWAESLGLPMLLLLTKADKLSRGQAAAVRSRVAAEVPDGVVAVTLFSALTGQGVDEARDQLMRWLEPPEAGAEAGTG
ncbi:MAG: YihA family ribosome biogenesis GTP-binding protein [Gammaproteobacteria bacterium]|nr:YihA family ribosome biogenesis GTP-binding protein [Gammaproteobacteria bacterium]